MSGEFPYAIHMYDTLEDKMNALIEIQKRITNSLTQLRYNYFPQHTMPVSYKGHNPKRGGDFEEQRYNLPSLEFLKGFLLAGNVGGEKPSDYARSVHFHNIIFQNEQIKAIAPGFDVETAIDADKRPSKEQPNFNAFMDTVKKYSKDFLLLHITDPFKKTAYEYAVKNNIHLSESAKISGVVNPFIFDSKGRIYADNIDGYAMLEAIEQKRKIQGLNVLLIGAGGGASSIALEALNRIGSGSIVILNRTVTNATELGEKLRAYKQLGEEQLITGGLDLLEQYSKQSDIIISAQTKNAGITEELAKTLPKETFFADINYGNTAEVAKIARQTGHDAIDGSPMVYHGVKKAAELAFEKKLAKKIDKTTIEKLKQEAGL